MTLIALAAALTVAAPAPGAADVAVGTRCTMKDAPAAIVAPFFRMPEIARALQSTGVSLVRVDLDAGGRLRGAAIFRSSGNRWLDGAAMETARMSRYRAETHRCVAVAGSYLVSVAFTEDDVR